MVEKKKKKELLILSVLKNSSVAPHEFRIAEELLLLGS
jgi:hypothetical protein